MSEIEIVLKMLCCCPGRWKKGPGAQVCRRPLAAGKSKEIDSSLEPPESAGPLMSCFTTSDLHCKIMILCCFNPLCLW